MSCKHCEYISQLFNRLEDMTNREYWTMTEIFVYLHNGKDYCDESIKNLDKGLVNEAKK